ncbi:MAG: branched-chain amino acid ABC transporter permease [Deltaproteobacteria bacterium]|nr:MAG: branched-chain amino acid ABC transporter permease [Deltaproteobacteria bacterium]
MNRVLRYKSFQVGSFGLLLALVPLLVTNRYYLTVMVFIGIHTLLVVGLNLLMGYAGQISLGHAAFFGLGAYTSGILTTTYHVSPWPAMVAAVVLTVTVALLVGIPALKLTGYYLAMATLGFGIIIHICFKELVWLTGGPSGLVGIPTLGIGKIMLDEPKAYYCLVWVATTAAIALSLNIVDSRVGRALRAIHDSESAAGASGISTSRLKIWVFAVSAVYASVAGSLYAHFITFISPSSFDFMFSVKLVTMVVVGGMASIWGAVFGAATLTVLPEVLTTFHDYDIVLFGLILMVVMIFMPQGLTRGALDIWDKYRFQRQRSLLVNR